MLKRVGRLSKYIADHGEQTGANAEVKFGEEAIASPPRKHV